MAINITGLIELNYVTRSLKTLKTSSSLRSRPIIIKHYDCLVLDLNSSAILEEEMRKYTRKVFNAMVDVTICSSKDMKKLKEVATNEDRAEQKDIDEVQKKFVLPPEYEENDSRWTLKYREPTPGLVELIQHSGVYVNADKLAECKRLPKVSKRLARLLLTEIFTTNALSICSWPGATANDSHIDGEQARPQLDEHAIDILLKFVEEYGLLRNWILADYQCILNHMRQVMLDMKRYGQTYDDDDDDELQEKSAHSHIHQTILEVRRDSQKEEDFDGLVEKDIHLRMYQIMLAIGRARIKKEDSCNEAPGTVELREHYATEVLNGQPRRGNFLTWITRACEKCIAAVCCTAWRDAESHKTGNICYSP